MIKTAIATIHARKLDDNHCVVEISSDCYSASFFVQTRHELVAHMLGLQRVLNRLQDVELRVITPSDKFRKELDCLSVSKARTSIITQEILQRRNIKLVTEKGK